MYIINSSSSCASSSDPLWVWAAQLPSSSPELHSADLRWNQDSLSLPGLRPPPRSCSRALWGDSINSLVDSFNLWVVANIFALSGYWKPLLAQPLFTHMPNHGAMWACSQWRYASSIHNAFDCTTSHLTRKGLSDYCSSSGCRCFVITQFNHYYCSFPIM